MPLEAKNISFRYDRKEPFVLENISLSVEQGEHLALFAPSGYGKTTLVKLIMGLYNPTEGEIKISGEDIAKYSILGETIDDEAARIYGTAPANTFSNAMGTNSSVWESLDKDRANGCIRDLEHAYTKDGGLAILFGNIAKNQHNAHYDIDNCHERNHQLGYLSNTLYTTD